LYAKEKCGVETVPQMIGPFTFLKISKGYKKEDFEKFLFDLAGAYNGIILELEKAGAKAFRLEEPSLACDISDAEIDLLIGAYKILTSGLNIETYVQVYYESLSAYKRITDELPVDGIGLDFAINDENFENVREYGFPKDKKLIAGIVSGRDIWKTDYKKAVRLLKELFTLASKESIIISNSSPLYHLPVSLNAEQNYLNEKLLKIVSFADERLAELETVKKIINENLSAPEQDFVLARELFKNDYVQKAVAEIDETKIGRKDSFAQRSALQREILNLPLFPTTTIGSYPQTAQVRKNRADFKKGAKTKEEYEAFIKEEIKKVIAFQEDLGIDVLVHGEFERTDMVEYFAQGLDGFAITKNGWVQSYGSRCVKPPVIFGDVSRPKPITVKYITFAQSLTEKPLKGMLTGPVTILNWCFYRKDISKKEIAFQIALALKDEVIDLEKDGVKIIQIDEAAFREGLPLKKSKQRAYLDWAVKSFKLAHQGVEAKTQVHSHMCYSEFNEILKDIYDMDADVISIEASRSKGEIIWEFEKLNYDRAIGLGVYDIHSPRVPSQEEIISIAERSIKVIDKSLFWINPDCGLKTRGYEETEKALRNMADAAKKLRENN
jgi:5-methyltetrahydropteroyltriglutamate--homocysteine methyltransferase